MAKEKRTETAYERHWDEFWNGYDDSRYNQTSPYHKNPLDDDWDDDDDDDYPFTKDGEDYLN